MYVGINNRRGVTLGQGRNRYVRLKRLEGNRRAKAEVSGMTKPSGASRAPVGDGFDAMNHLGLLQEFLSNLLAGGAKPRRVRAGGTLHDEAVKEEFGQFLFCKGSRHGSFLPTELLRS